MASYRVGLLGVPEEAQVVFNVSAEKNEQFFGYPIRVERVKPGTTNGRYDAILAPADAQAAPRPGFRVVDLGTLHVQQAVELVTREMRRALVEAQISRLGRA